MKQQEPYLQNSFNDIIFEGRNRDYGAYALRVLIPKHTRFATLAIATIVGLAIISRYVSFNFGKQETEPIYLVETVSLSDPPPIFEELPLPVPPSIAPKPAEALAEIEVKKDADVVSTEVSTENTAGDSTATGTSAEGVNTNSKLTGSGHTVYTNPEIQAEYVGGTKALKKYLSTNVKYPQVAKENGITGTVIVVFVVDTDGSVKDVKIKQGIGGGCDQEAIRVVENMKRWKPGKQGDVPVPTLVALPITFSVLQQ